MRAKSWHQLFLGGDVRRRSAPHRSAVAVAVPHPPPAPTPTQHRSPAIAPIQSPPHRDRAPHTLTLPPPTRHPSTHRHVQTHARPPGHHPPPPPLHEASGQRILQRKPRRLDGNNQPLRELLARLEQDTDVCVSCPRDEERRGTSTHHTHARVTRVTRHACSKLTPTADAVRRANGPEDAHDRLGTGGGVSPASHW